MGAKAGEVGNAKRNEGTPATPRDIALYISNFKDHLSATFPLVDFPRDPPASQYEGSMSLWSALDGNVITAEQAADIATRAHESYLPRAARWLEHYDNRLAYERAMLNEAIGVDGAEANGMAARVDFKAGGRILTGGGEWLVIIRVNQAA